MYASTRIHNFNMACLKLRAPGKRKKRNEMTVLRVLHVSPGLPVFAATDKHNRRLECLANVCRRRVQVSVRVEKRRKFLPRRSVVPIKTLFPLRNRRTNKIKKKRLPQKSAIIAIYEYNKKNIKNVRNGVKFAVDFSARPDEFMIHHVFSVSLNVFTIWRLTFRFRFSRARSSATLG